MIFSQLVSHFGRAGRQGVDGNLTGLSFSLTLLACRSLEEEDLVLGITISNARSRTDFTSWSPGRLPCPQSRQQHDGYGNKTGLCALYLRTLTSSAPPVLLIRDPINFVRHRSIVIREPLQTRDALDISIDHLRFRIQSLRSTYCD